MVSHVERDDRDVGRGKLSRDNRRRIAAAGVVTLPLLWAGLASAIGGQDAEPQPSPSQRFTLQADGVFPPQPRGATEVRALESTRVATQDRARRAADPVAQAALADALGADFVEIGASEVTGKDGTRRYAEYFSNSNNQTVVATVNPDGAEVIEAIPATDYQPPLARAEVDDAVAIARTAFVAGGERRAGALEGYAILALPPDGAPFHPSRLAYVTFHPNIDSPPELIAVVDLVAGVVTETREA